MRGLSVEDASGWRASRWIAALLLLSVCLLAWAPAARGGEWTQVTCTQPDGKPAPNEATEESWTGTSVGGLSPYSSVNNDCGQQGGYLVAANSSRFTVPRSTGPMWEYAAPPGSTIAGGSIAVSLTAPQGTAYVATPNNIYGADVLANCQFNEQCGSSGSFFGPYSAVVPIEHLGGTRLYAAAMCVGPGQPGTSTEDCAAGDGANGLNAQTIVYAADIELQNNSTPAGTNFAGSLLEPNTSGTADLTFNAEDPEGPGVYRVIVDVDGTAVYQGTPEANGGRCASIGVDSNGVSEFLYPQPCKRSVAVDVPINTAKLSNGSHPLEVTVQDAAGNHSTVYAGTISIDNPGSSTGTPIGPGSPAAVRGAPNGMNASDQAKLTARWNSTAKPTRTSGYGQADRITGRLSASTGQPISGAALDVFQTPAYQGAKATSLPSVRTGSTGSWTLTLPRGVCTSTLHFTYRSHVDDTVPVVTTTLTLRVHAGIRLRIAPRVTSVGHRILFTGVLHGLPIPEEGKQLVLEARSGAGEWIQFNTIRTDAEGRYRASYRFKFPGPVTYQFRVLSRFESGFPFLDGASNVVDVHEH
jgi:hypothetical protein